MLEIAIVEDEENYRNVLCDYLKKFENETGEEIHASIFTDGDEIVENYTAKYDIILMDIEMESKYAGITATSQILREFPKIKIVILTVYEDDEMIYNQYGSVCNSGLCSGCT